MKKNQSDSSWGFVSQLCEWVVVAVLHIIPIVVPLFFFISNEEIFEFNKMLLTYALTIVVCSAWLGQIIINKKLYFKRTPIDFLVIGYLLTQLVSTVLSIHPRTSIFGYYTRFHGGLLSTFTYIILFYATYTFIGKKYLKSFLMAVVIGALISALYAFPEHFGHSPSCVLLNEDPATLGFTADCWIQDVQSRVFGTFGQPNWLAAYLILTLPVFVSLMTILISEEKFQWKKSLLTVGSILGTFLLFSTLLFTKSRSGFLGLGVGGLAFVLLLPAVLMKTGKHLRGSLLALLMFAGVTVGGVAAWFGTPLTPSIWQFITPPPQATEQAVVPKVESSPLVEIGGTDSGQIRKIVWKGAIDVWKRYPWFGSGVETFAYSYYTDRPMEHNLVSEWDFLYNKAHNELLNILATTGVFGLVSYLLLFGAILLILVRVVLTNERWEYRLIALGLLSGQIALHISNFFGFSTVAVTATTHLMTGAFYGVVLSKSALVKLPTINRLSIGQITLLGGVAILGVFLVFQVWAIWLADHYFYKAKNAYNAGDLYETLNNSQRAIELSPKEGLFYELYSKATAQYAYAAFQENDQELTKQLANSALQAGETTLYLNPVHLNFYKTRNFVLVQLALIDPQYYNDAVETLEAARKLSPTDPKLVYFEGVVTHAQGKTEDAISHLKQAIEMKPNYDAARYLLGKIYEEAREYELATEQYTYILTQINPNNADVKARLESIATISAKD